MGQFNRKAMFGRRDGAEYETPQELFDALNEEFGFVLDVCATEENAKCERFFSPEEDGLLHPWFGPAFMNPPYGSAIRHWVEKAAWEAQVRGVTVVCLLPSRTDTKSWFHRYIWDGEKHRARDGVQVRFLEGRLTFSKREWPAPFPSMVVVFWGRG